MTLKKHLEDFYKKNNIPIHGGVNDISFNLKVFGVNLKLPNPKFRRDVIHIHDIQHILHERDTSWKGESFISGWEISTGMWKYFPLGLLSLWAMGYGLWLYPKDIFIGYKKGLRYKGVIDLEISKKQFLAMELDELISLIKKEKPSSFGILEIVMFIAWAVISQIILLSPVLLIVLGIAFTF
jgi:hypothetical protein